MSKNCRIETINCQKCGGARGGGARLESDRMSANDCGAGVCPAEWEIFKTHGVLKIETLTGCRKSPSGLFRQPVAAPPGGGAACLPNRPFSVSKISGNFGSAPQTGRARTALKNLKTRKIFPQPCCCMKIGIYRLSSVPAISAILTHRSTHFGCQHNFLKECSQKSSCTAVSFFV